MQILENANFLVTENDKKLCWDHRIMTNRFIRLW